MVYRGKPSPGCARCRKRKIRCDQGKPACNNCNKSNLDCPGYRDLTGLMFLDQSSDVVRKNKDSKPRGVSPPKPTPETTEKESPSRTITPELIQTFSGTLSILQLRPVLPDLSMNYFFESYISGAYKAFFPWDYDVSQREPLLTNAISCIATASFANRFGSEEASHLAYESYQKALLAAYKDLQNPEKVNNDQTLIAIYLLSKFENLFCDSPDSFPAWISHVEGCEALLRTRHQHHARSDLERAVLVFTASARVLWSFWNHSAPPPIISESLNAVMFDGPTRPSDFLLLRILRLAVQCSYFRARIGEDDLTDPATIVARTRSLDEELINWHQDAYDAGEDWRYKTVNDSSSTETTSWLGRYHLYKTSRSAAAWQLYRFVRLEITNRLDIHLTRLGRNQDSQEHMEVMARRSQLTSDICTGAAHQVEFENHDDNIFFGCNLAFSAAFIMPWMLYFIGRDVIILAENAGTRPANSDSRNSSAVNQDSINIRHSQLQWITSQLRQAFRMHGMRSSNMFADTLEEGWKLVIDSKEISTYTYRERAEFGELQGDWLMAFCQRKTSRSTGKTASKDSIFLQGLAAGEGEGLALEHLGGADVDSAPSFADE